MKELKGELSGKLCTAVLAMGEPSNEYDASELRKVLRNFLLGTSDVGLPVEHFRFVVSCRTCSV